MGDRYEGMIGADLAAELAKRELPVSGKVEELRDRLREDDEAKAQKDADAPDPAPEGEETEADGVEVPEPRQPIEQFTVQCELSEETARELTRLEARVAQFLKHVAPSKPFKYCAGDRVIGIDLGDGYVHVIASGVRIKVDTENEEG
jgi:hypothetical protein